MSEHSSQSIPEIGVKELASLIANDLDRSIQLIDVREPDEIAIAHVEGFTDLPLSQFQTWSASIHTDFDRHAETLVMCHHGMRSAQMCQWLINQGFTNVKNIRGGIDAYSDLDPSMARY